MTDSVKDEQNRIAVKGVLCELMAGRGSWTILRLVTELKYGLEKETANLACGEYVETLLSDLRLFACTGCVFYYLQCDLAAARSLLNKDSTELFKPSPTQWDRLLSDQTFDPDSLRESDEV